MTQEPGFDVQSAHRYFSSQCFNRAWDLMDKPDRTPEDDEAMIHLNMASVWHWTQRPDCTATNLSIGYWQASRIYALLDQADNARHYGQLSLAASREEGVKPFYLAYAWEALARAEMIAGDRQKMAAFLRQARDAVEQVTDPEERKLLLDDLATIG